MDNLVSFDPNEHLCNVAGQEADDEEYHHNCDEAQSSLHFCLLSKPSPSELDNDVEGAVNDHGQWQVEGEEKHSLVPVEAVVRFGFNHETFTFGGVDMFQ